MHKFYPIKNNERKRNLKNLETAWKLVTVRKEIKKNSLRAVWVFWVNIAKFKVNLRYRNCWKLIGKLRRETEFRQRDCRNSAKKQEREEAKGERENVEFRQWDCRNSTAQFYCLSAMCPSVPECGVLLK